MKIKVLEPAAGRRGATVVAIDGQLRVIDPPGRPCMGFANGCICGACSPRARRSKLKAAQRADRCECDRPLVTEGGCSKCGKPLPLPVAA
jgi:hypothetical protein